MFYSKVNISETSLYLYYHLSLQVNGNIFVKYNMGTEAHPIGQLMQKHNDGKYHILRFERSGANATLQIDDGQIVYKTPAGNTDRCIYRSLNASNFSGFNWKIVVPLKSRLCLPFFEIVLLQHWYIYSGTGWFGNMFQLIFYYMYSMMLYGLEYLVLNYVCFLTINC